jgi:hypothetical protein
MVAPAGLERDLVIVDDVVPSAFVTAFICGSLPSSFQRSNFDLCGHGGGDGI